MSTYNSTLGTLSLSLSYKMLDENDTIRSPKSRLLFGFPPFLFPFELCLTPYPKENHIFLQNLKDSVNIKSVPWVERGYSYKKPYSSYLPFQRWVLSFSGLKSWEFSSPSGLQ